MSLTRVSVVLVAVFGASCAAAQPQSYTDLGRHVEDVSAFMVRVHLLSHSDIQWYRIELPTVTAEAGFVDFGTTMNEEYPIENMMLYPKFAIYDEQGHLLPRCGFDGVWNSGHTSYGLREPERAQPSINGEDLDDEEHDPPGRASTYEGQCGALTEGVYWIAIGNGSVVFGESNWDVRCQSPPNNSRDTLLTFYIWPPHIPFCDPDLDWSGVADQDDVAYLVNVMAGGYNDTNRSPDYNQDGLTDQDDILALINVIAGGECP